MALTAWHGFLFGTGIWQVFFLRAFLADSSLCVIWLLRMTHLHDSKTIVFAFRVTKTISSFATKEIASQTLRVWHLGSVRTTIQAWTLALTQQTNNRFKFVTLIHTNWKRGDNLLPMRPTFPTFFRVGRLPVTWYTLFRFFFGGIIRIPSSLHPLNDAIPTADVQPEQESNLELSHLSERDSYQSSCFSFSLNSVQHVVEPSTRTAASATETQPSSPKKNRNLVIKRVR